MRNEERKKTAGQKVCESCGMPMRKKGEFGGGRTDNKYCVYCTDKKGNLKTYPDVLEGLKNFIISRMGIREDEALNIARENLSKMPAWQHSNK
ncbi:MAG: zinc ribbon domain-containing protein [Spirochaetota bacterium]